MGFHLINLGSNPSRNILFKTLYNYYYSLNDTPSIMFKLNLWAYINIRFFKLKVSHVLSFFINSVDSLKLKYIKVFHKTFNFENFFFTYILIIVLISTILLF